MIRSASDFISSNEFGFAKEYKNALWYTQPYSEQLLLNKLVTKIIVNIPENLNSEDKKTIEDVLEKPEFLEDPIDYVISWRANLSWGSKDKFCVGQSGALEYFEDQLKHCIHYVKSERATSKLEDLKVYIDPASFFKLERDSNELEFEDHNIQSNTLELVDRNVDIDPANFFKFWK